MTSRALIRIAVLGVLALAASSASASAQGVGIKVGPTFANFSSDALDFKTRTGIHAGLFRWSLKGINGAPGQSTTENTEGHRENENCFFSVDLCDLCGSSTHGQL